MAAYVSPFANNGGNLAAAMKLWSLFNQPGAGAGPNIGAPEMNPAGEEPGPGIPYAPQAPAQSKDVPPPPALHDATKESASIINTSGNWNPTEFASNGPENQGSVAQQQMPNNSGKAGDAAGLAGLAGLCG